MKRNTIIMFIMSALVFAACKKTTDTPAPTPTPTPTPTGGPNSFVITGQGLTNQVINFEDTASIGGYYDPTTRITNIQLGSATKNSLTFAPEIQLKSANTGSRGFYADEFVNISVDKNGDHIDYEWKRGTIVLTPPFPTQIGQNFVGTFEGVYKNMVNSNDSLVITKGKFSAKRRG